VQLGEKKLGVLLAAPPDQPNFGRGIRLAEAAMERGAQVYVYCIDDAVAGLNDAKLQALKVRGAKLFACAFGAQRRNVSLTDLATFAGLSTVNELIAHTDRFVAFN